MLRLILHILSNALGILVAAKLVSGIEFSGDWKRLLLAGAVLGFINFFLRPILKIISMPLIWLTLGLFSILINMFLFNLVPYVVPSLFIETWIAAFWGIIVISLINYIVASLVKE